VLRNTRDASSARQSQGIGTGRGLHAPLAAAAHRGCTESPATTCGCSRTAQSPSAHLWPSRVDTASLQLSDRSPGLPGRSLPSPALFRRPGPRDSALHLSQQRQPAQPRRWFTRRHLPRFGASPNARRQRSVPLSFAEGVGLGSDQSSMQRAIQRSARRYRPHRPRATALPRGTGPLPTARRCTHTGAAGAGGDAVGLSLTHSRKRGWAWAILISGEQCQQHLGSVGCTVANSQCVSPNHFKATTDASPRRSGEVFGDVCRQSRWER
jgi:hypothetical protein